MIIVFICEAHTHTLITITDQRFLWSCLHKKLYLCIHFNSSFFLFCFVFNFTVLLIAKKKHPCTFSSSPLIFYCVQCEKEILFMRQTLIWIFALDIFDFTLDKSLTTAARPHSEEFWKLSNLWEHRTKPNRSVYWCDSMFFFGWSKW